MNTNARFVQLLTLDTILDMRTGQLFHIPNMAICTIVRADPHPLWDHRRICRLVDQPFVPWLGKAPDDVATPDAASSDAT